jgi:hypothetical protein
VSPESLKAARTRIAELTHTVLNGATTPPKLEATRGGEVTATGIAAFASGMGPLLGHWIERGTITADPELEALLARHLDHGRRRAVNLHTQLHRLLQALNERRIIPTVLKGLHTSQCYFPEPGTRPCADIDLLVPPDQSHEAQGALRATGLDKLQSPAPGQTEWGLAGGSRSPQSLELDHASNPWAVDLHTSVDIRYLWGLWARFGNRPYTMTRPWKVDGCRGSVFTQPLLAAHLAVHAAFNFHQLRLIRLVELVLVLRHDTGNGTLTWDALAGLLADTKTARFAYPALELCERLAPGTVDPDFRDEMMSASTRRTQRMVEQQHVSGADAFIRKSLDNKFMWAKGPKELALNTVDFLWPAAGPRSLGPRLAMYRRRVHMLLRGLFSLRAGNRQ